MPKGYSQHPYRRGPAPGWVYQGRKPGRKPKGNHLPLIRRYVGEEGLTHREAGERIGIHRSRVSQLCIEYGIRRQQ